MTVPVHRRLFNSLGQQPDNLTARLLRYLSGVSLAIGILVLLNQLRIPFYLYYPRTTHTVLTSETIDRFLFLISSLCVPITIASFTQKLSRRVEIEVVAIWVAAGTLTIVAPLYGAPILYAALIVGTILSILRTEEPLRTRRTADVIQGTLAALLLIEFSASYYWITSSLNPQNQVGLSAEVLETNLTYSIGALTPFLLIVLLLGWLWIPLWRFVPLLGQRVVRHESEQVSRPNSRVLAASLDLIAILSILVFYYPYVAGQAWIVGRDSYKVYSDPLSSLTGLSTFEAFTATILHGVYVTFLYVIHLTTGVSPFSIVKYAPSALTFLLGCAVFFVVLRTGWGLPVALLSSITTIMWLPTTLGIFGGIQANWAAYVIWMAFLSLYFLSREWNALVFLIECSLSLIMFFIHPWTWGIFLATLVLTLILSFRTELRTRCWQGLLAALTTILVGGSAFLFLPGLRGDLGNMSYVYGFSLFHPDLLLLFAGAFREMLLTWSSFLPPSLLLISVIGAYSLSGRRGIGKNYLLAWIAVWCIGSVLVAPQGYNPANPATSETQLWRMLYLSTLPILLALGIDECLTFCKRQWESNKINLAFQKPHLLLVSPIILFSIGLFISQDSLLSLLMLLGGVLSVFLLLVRIPRRDAARILLFSFLILLLVNAAFRSLYPLLLSPQNLFNPVQR